ncbi:hypothetical protein IKG41_01320 [Candidatus Saccharibacteria bacterium]|nr:hypothetical protein [Candidatus Saccharibacteria bacterium]
MFSVSNAHAYSLTISANDVSIDVISGETSISEAPIEIISDCRAGYTFSVSTSTDATGLRKNGSSSAEITFEQVDGSKTLANSTNKWGYYYNDIAVPTDSTVFSSLSTTPEILRTPSETASVSDIDDTFTIYYGANAADTVSPGLYKMVNNGSLQYYAVTDPSCGSYNIIYDGNNADAGISMSVEHTGVALDDEVILYAPNYKKAGYGFAGWSTVQLNPDSSTFSSDLADAVSDDLVFGPNETITLTHAMAKKADQNYRIKLYAVWIKSTDDMQNWNCPNNTDMPIGSVVALTDTRDNNVYTVAKLADGNCWMAENLRLGTVGSDDQTKSQRFSGGFGGLANPESSNFINTSTVANSLYSIDGSTTYTISGDNQGSRFPRYNSDNTVSAISDMTSGDQNIYGYGNYYTWPAANASIRSFSETADTTSSICPKGWALPTGNLTTDYYSFGALSAALGGPSDGSSIASTTAAEKLSAAFRSFPNNYIYSGHFTDSTVGSKTATGAYWTRTTNNGQSSYNFYIASNDVRPATNVVNNGRGNTVRCINTPTFYINYNKNASDAIGEGAYGYSFRYKSNFSWGDSVTSAPLRTSNYKRTGYGFAGWSTDPNLAEHINEQNHSRIYGPEEQITVFDNNLVSHADENRNIPLYAVWIPSAGNLQNWNGCNTLSTGKITALTDIRDNQTYTIAKLADGRCWMIENLRLDPSEANITTSNTNNPTSSFISQASTSSSIDPSDWCDIGTSSTCVDKFAFSAVNLDALSTKSGYGLSKYNFGVYYNWYVATAGNGTYNDTNVATGTGQAKGDICPIGWHLPTGGPSSEQDNYRNILKQAGGQFDFPNNLVHSGLLTDPGSINGIDDNLFLYSSSASLDSNGRASSGGYALFIYGYNPSQINDSSGQTRKTRGNTIRCINGSTLNYKISTMTKGMQTASDLKAVITKPTSNDPSVDTSNSGVYSYNSSVFGTSSDESNDRQIYYYRGILDSDLNGSSTSYGSAGNGAYYPNYVKLTTTTTSGTYNTCWRIMRTTGSGGVKLIYNGVYGATTSGSCANAQTNARLPDVIAYGLKGSSNQSTYWYRNINRVGYSFNNATSIRDSATSTAVGTVFGNSSNFSTTNTTKSNIQNYLYNYFNNTLGQDFVGKLEQNSGFCNDRSVFSNAAGTTAITSIVPYSATATAYFGGYARHLNTGGKPTLTCSRGKVDVYSSGAYGDIEPNNGNSQTQVPIGLPTADELALSGLGNATTYGQTSTYSSNYNYNSFTRHGGGIWTMTPSGRTSSGESQVIVTATSGNFYGRNVSDTSGIRPVITLKAGTIITGGAGTATNPWTVE